jgi:hypothetical protein
MDVKRENARDVASRRDGKRELPLEEPVGGESISSVMAVREGRPNALVALMPVDLDVKADETERVGFGRRSRSVERDGGLCGEFVIDGPLAGTRGFELTLMTLLP